MAGNRDTLDALLESGGIHLQPSASLDQLPASFPTDFDFSKIEGMMLVLAVGDALGNTTEGKLPLRQLHAMEQLHSEVAGVAAGSFRKRRPPEITGSGYVVASLEAALWAFHDASDFEEAVLRAVNLGDDADTTGAVCVGSWPVLVGVSRGFRLDGDIIWPDRT